MTGNPIRLGRLALATALAGRLLPGEPVMGAAFTTLRPLGRRQAVVTPTAVVVTDRRLLFTAVRYRVRTTAMTAPDSWALWTDGDPEFLGERAAPLTRWPEDGRLNVGVPFVFVHAPPAWFGTIEDVVPTAARPVTVPGVLPEGSAQMRLRVTRSAPGPGLDISGYDVDIRSGVLDPLTAALAGPHRRALPAPAPEVVRDAAPRLTLRRVGALFRPTSREDARTAIAEGERAVSDVLARLPGGAG